MGKNELGEIKDKLTRIDTTITHVATASEKELKLHSEKLDKFDERLRALENWKWFIMGGILVLGAVIYYASNMILSVLRNGVQK